MTSRRPMTRTYSANGRAGSFSEDEGNGSNGRADVRSNSYLSNVRPENRSTLCTVMAQLTEDIQPSFDSTLKSKAVSENCNVKFTCVVSGYPAPELKWYKDDMEMDRYCGLPKYEIRKNGKTHTLHIYNCTLDDAAIYQVSASNSKGIVSCSGVLEVGTMSEYKIHQRFFAKLKQKAEKKKRELEDTKREDKENIQKETQQLPQQQQNSPERPPRKRHIPPPPPPPPQEKLQDKEPAVGAAAEPNGVTMEVKEMEFVTTTDSGKEKEDSLAQKKPKMSNGVDVGMNSSSSSSSNNSRSHMMGNGGENCYDGGISLAQFLAETLQSQAAEEKQNSPQADRAKEVIAKDGKEMGRTQSEQEERGRAPPGEEIEKGKEEEQEKLVEPRQKRESSMERLLPHSKHDNKHHSKFHKDHEHHHIQASFSSMLHTVKDFFFGKSKKDSHDRSESKEKLCDQDSVPKPETTPPSFRLQPDIEVSIEESMPMETDHPDMPAESVDISQQPPKPKLEDGYPHKVQVPDGQALPPESTEEYRGQESVKETKEPAEAMEVTEGPGDSEDKSLYEPPVLSKVELKESQTASVITEVPVNQPEPDRLISPLQPVHPAARNEDKSSAAMEIPAPIKEAKTIPSLEESWIPPSILISVPKSLEQATQEEKLTSDKTCADTKPPTEKEEGSSASIMMDDEEEAEVKTSEQTGKDINRPELSELPLLEERIEEIRTPDEVLSPLPPEALHSGQEVRLKEDKEGIKPIQEVNLGFLAVAAQESVERVDMQIPECAVSTLEESVQNHKQSVSQSSGEEERDLKESLHCPLAKSLDISLCNEINKQELVIFTEEKSEVGVLQFDAETKNKVSEVDESKISLEPGSEESKVLEGHRDIADENNGERCQENIPQIHISIMDDPPKIEPIVPLIIQQELFIIPKIEIMGPELKEKTLLEESKLEPAALETPDATHMSEMTVQDTSGVYSMSSPPTQPSMQSQEVAQSQHEVDIFVEKENGSKLIPVQLDFSSIPLINVSHSDDKEDQAFVSADVSHPEPVPTETPAVPLFVVPPISITCHESDLKVPTQSERSETETSDDTRKGTEQEVAMSMKPTNRIQNGEEVTEKGVKEISSCPSEVPKVVDVQMPQKTKEENIVPEIKSLKEQKIENLIEEVQRVRPPIDRLAAKPPAPPSLSPSSLRKFMSRASPDSDAETGSVPIITVGDRQSDKADEDLSGGSTPTSLSRESSPRMKRRDSLTLIRSATPEELASGARRKIFILKPKEDADVVGLEGQVKKESPYMSPSQARRAALLQTSKGQNTPPMERRSPLLNRRKATLEVPKVMEEPPKDEPTTKKEEKPAEKKPDPLKAPQVIRKIRGEPFPDASGHLKLWCQFFNVLSDSTIKWYRDEEEILEVKRSKGDESQVALAIVLATSQDCGVYGCTINNEYGTDSTDFLLSADVLSEILLKDDLEVGEEIEMTPLLFTKGLVDTGTWGEKYFGRIMTETVHMGEGWTHKACRVKVIYGLDPIFDSGTNCIIKIQNPIAYGRKEESNLAERNLEITKQECKVQNMMREYCKIFTAEARVNENFGFSLEVIPRYLMYRPANSVPYATVEADLDGDYQQYCAIDSKGKLLTRTVTEVEQKCNSFQHWIHQWTHGNLLVTRLEGVETKLTNIGVVTKSKGYQGLTESGSPDVFDQFMTHHHCNYYCGLLGLRSLKPADNQTPKIKGSRSPLLNRKLSTGSPQLQRKGHSPQMPRKANASPKVPRKAQEVEDSKSDPKPKPAETIEIR